MSLSVDKVKSLEPGAWLWIKFAQNISKGAYWEVVSKTEKYLVIESTAERHQFLFFDGCGTKWFAYNSKEQASGDYIELPCINIPPQLGIPIYEVIYRTKYGTISVETCYDIEEAQDRLAQLKLKEKE